MVDLRPLLFANALMIMVMLTLGYAGLQGLGPSIPGLLEVPWQNKITQSSVASQGPSAGAAPAQHVRSQIHPITPPPSKEEQVREERVTEIAPTAEIAPIESARDTAGEPKAEMVAHKDVSPAPRAPVISMAMVRLSANVDQGRIQVNGQYSGLGNGDSEAILELPPGEHNIHVSKPGHAPWQQQLQLKPGDDRRLIARLEPFTRVEYRNGEWRHDLVSGEGSYRDEEGLYYEGEFLDKAFHGQGKAVWPDGRQYQGDWVEGKMQGHGELHQEDGSHYRGEFRNNRFHGRGTLTTAQSDRFTGQWSQGKLNGHGVLSFQDGTLYVGDLREERFHGEGTLTFADGRLYQGEFVDNQFHGQGSKTFRSGRRYTGRFAHGEFHGPGTLYHPNGGRISGTFREGDAYGEVRLTTPQGERFIARTSEPGVCYREEYYRATQCPPMDGW